jgi:isopenicillin N synthase-like dioxygenase
MLELSRLLLRVLARGLPKEWNVQEPEKTMLEFAETPSMPMRLLHYAPQPFKDENQFGGKSCPLAVGKQDH